MHKQDNRSAGFTIVELLIVIVVVSILAAISIVAYTGIQNRADDSAVQSDLTNFAKKITLYHAEFGRYPTGNGGTPTEGVGRFSLAKGSYLTGSTSNFYYCEGTVSGVQAYAVGAASASNNRFYYSSLVGGLRPYTGTFGSMIGWCTGMLPGVEAGYTRSYGYDGNTQSWAAWTQ